MTGRASRKKAKPAPPDLVTGETPRLADAPGLVMVVDTREQQPLDFTGICPAIRATLSTGDYSIVGAETTLCLERKALSDLHSTIISDRTRFVRELERMRSYEFAAIIIEGTLRDVLDYRPPDKAARHFTPAQLDAHPRTIINSLVSWSLEYGVRVFFVDQDRALCRALVLSLARRFWRKRHPLTASGILGTGTGAAKPDEPTPAA